MDLWTSGRLAAPGGSRQARGSTSGLPFDSPIRNFNFDQSKQILATEESQRNGNLIAIELNVQFQAVRTRTFDAAFQPIVVGRAAPAFTRTAWAAASRDSITTGAPGMS